MRIINLKRQKASKHVEHNSEGLKNHSVAATSTPEVSMSDESQRSAINPKSWLHLLKMRIINREPRSTFVTTKHEKEQQKSKSSQSALHRLLNHGDWQQERYYFRNSNSSELNIETQSQFDRYPVLLTSNSGTASSSNTLSVRNKKRDSLQFELSIDPRSSHPSIPICSNSDLRESPKSRWGTVDLAASSNSLEAPLKVFEKHSLRMTQPKFRIGPRKTDNTEKTGSGDRASMNSSKEIKSIASLDIVKHKHIGKTGSSDRAPMNSSKEIKSIASLDIAKRKHTGKTGSSDRASMNSSKEIKSIASLDIAKRKHRLIFQDGKLVKREVHPWPYNRDPKMMLRYKASEPYASNYGKHSAHRTERVRSPPSTKVIDYKPIFRVPRAIVDYNKRRLLARYTLKTLKEPLPGKIYCMPVKVNLMETEQSRRTYEEYRKFQKQKIMN